MESGASFGWIAVADFSLAHARWFILALSLHGEVDGMGEVLLLDEERDGHRAEGQEAHRMEGCLPMKLRYAGTQPYLGTRVGRDRGLEWEGIRAKALGG